MKEFRPKNIKLVIEYDGADFDGWQRNPNMRTVQGEIEKALSKILNEETQVKGAGRTDAGVHAKGQVANFTLKKEFDLKKLVYALNGLLPKDAAVVSAKKVKPDFHSRHSAKLKSYLYIVRNNEIPSPLDRRHSVFYPYKLDIPAMKKGAKELCGRHDFRVFSYQDERGHSLRELEAVSIRRFGKYLHIEFRGRSFLRRMVRIMTGLLLQIGAGRVDPGSVKKILSGKEKYSPLTMPPHGLYLKQIKY